MKKFTTIFVMAAFALFMGSCVDNGKTDNNAENDDSTAVKTTLVAYFTASELRTTERVAKHLAEATDADLFEILPALAYTTEDLDWRDEDSRSTVEMKDSTARPEIAIKLENMDQYNTIYVGFPIWWYTAPRIINTFLEQYDFTGKTIIPFATSGGSGMGNSGEDLKKASAPNANWILPGKVLNGNPPVDSLKAWIATLDLK